MLYRAGKYREAVGYLDGLDQAEDLLYLAMAYRKLGRIEEATQTYELASSRLEATYPKHPGWRRLQQEAATLLGLDR